MENKSKNGLVFKKETDEKGFLRKTFLSLAADKNAPDDVLEAEFSEPVPDTMQAVVIETDVNLNYSASIGYRRAVEKKVYNKSKRVYETKKETVVDYQPISSTFSHTCNGYAENSDTPREELASPIATAYRTAKRENRERPSDSTADADYPIAAKAAALKSAKHHATLVAANACKGCLPGDTFKDFSYSGSAEITSQAEFTLPVYSVEYKYGESNYTASAFASGEYSRWGKLPERKKKEEKLSENKSFFSMVFATLKGSAEGNGGTSGNLVKLTSLLTILSVFFSVLTIFLSLSFHTLGVVLFVLSSAVIIGQTVALPLVIEYNYSKLKERKLSALAALFEKHKLSPASEEEVDIVRSSLGMQMKENKNLNTLNLVICIFLYAVAAISSGMYLLGLIFGLIIGGVKAALYFKAKAKKG